MPLHPMPQRTAIAAPIDDRVVRAVRLLAAALVGLLLASAPMEVRAASVLSDASVTPTTGTTATVFTFSVHYTSTGSPAQPAGSVWADVAGTTVALGKVSGSAHDGTWQGTATLPAGTWPVTFNASSGDPPAPLPGPIVTVSGPPPPTPSPTPAPTQPPTPQPTSPPTPRPAPQPTPPPTAPGDPTEAPASPSTVPSDAGSASPTATASPSRTADESADPSATAEPTDLAADDTATPASMFASLLIVGGTMSLAGAAVLARQWFVARGARPR